MTLLISNKDGLYADRRIVILHKDQETFGFTKGTKLFTCPQRRYHVAYTGDIPVDWQLYADAVYGLVMKEWLKYPGLTRVKIETGDKTGFKDIDGLILRTPWFTVLYHKLDKDYFKVYRPEYVESLGSTVISAKSLSMDIRDGDKHYPPVPIKEIYELTAKFDSCVSRDYDSGLVKDLSRRKPSKALITKMAVVPDTSFREPLIKPDPIKKSSKARKTARKSTN